MRAPALFAVLALAALALPSPAAAQIPQVMNYQVMVTDADDQPLPGMHELTFRIYTEESGGSVLWTETQNLEANSIGVVSIVLGSVNPISILWNAPRWLEVQIDGEIMSPRRRLTTSPYAFKSEDSNHLGGLWADGYATDGELSTPGTINQPSNPVDWTKLKGVPSGFADGADDAGGSGDGHSLDAADGSPADVVYVDAAGNVGIGTTSPDIELHVHQGGADPSCYLHFTHQVTGSGPGDGLYVGTDSSGLSYLYSYEDQPLALGTNNQTVVALQDNGEVHFGNEYILDGAVEIYRAGTSDPVVDCDSDGYGGVVRLFDELGNLIFDIWADGDDTGGEIEIARNDAATLGIHLDGNYDGTEEPALHLLGSSRSARFRMSEVGDASVVLPDGAINNWEILDEPGVASELQTSSVGIGTGYTTIASRSITVPASGYVLVMAGASIRVVHSGVMSDADFGVSSSPSILPTSQTITLTIPSTAGDGTYYFPGSYDAIFPVGAGGTYTYYFLGKEYSGAFTAYDAHLSLVYFPTDYGLVDPPVLARENGARGEEPEPREGLTAAEIAEERAEAEAFHLARIERELAAMRAELEQVKTEMSMSRRREDGPEPRTEQPRQTEPLRPAIQRPPAE